LIEFPDGRLQALSIAWDSRPKQQGGTALVSPIIQTSGLLMRTSSLDASGAKLEFHVCRLPLDRTCARVTIPLPTNSKHAGRKSTSVVKPAMVPAHAIWHGPKPMSEGKHATKDEAKGLIARLDERRGVVWNQKTQRPGNAARSIRTFKRARDRGVRAMPRAAGDRLPRAMRQCNRFSITTVRHCSRARSITLMDNSATKSTSGAHSCRARCMRVASLAATATIRTAESSVLRTTRSAPPATCQVSTTPQATIITNQVAPARPASCVTCRQALIWLSIRGAITACACRGRICLSN
jgi:hypothetical protein